MVDLVPPQGTFEQGRFHHNSGFSYVLEDAHQVHFILQFLVTSLHEFKLRLPSKALAPIQAKHLEPLLSAIELDLMVSLDLRLQPFVNIFIHSFWFFACHSFHILITAIKVFLVDVKSLVELHFAILVSFKLFGF